MRKRFGFTEGFMIGGIIMGLLAFVISSYMAKYFWSEEYTNYLINMENIQRYSYCPYCGEELEIGFKDK